MDEKKQSKLKRISSLFHSASEGIMVFLLVLVFTVPFVFAIALTPGYRKSVDRVVVSNRPEPPSVGSAEGENSKKVLGVETEKSLKMVVPAAMKTATLESYTMSKTEGFFRYRVFAVDEENVLTVRNEGSSRADIKVWLSDLLGGEAFVGTEKYTNALNVALDPGEDFSIKIKPSTIGKLDIQVVSL